MYGQCTLVVCLPSAGRIMKCHVCQDPIHVHGNMKYRVTSTSLGNVSEVFRVGLLVASFSQANAELSRERKFKKE